MAVLTVFVVMVMIMVIMAMALFIVVMMVVVIMIVAMAILAMLMVMIMVMVVTAGTLMLIHMEVDAAVIHRMHHRMLQFPLIHIHNGSHEVEIRFFRRFETVVVFHADA